MYLSACLHTVSDWGSTPATASKITTRAVEDPAGERSTSAVKSTCPGVSMMLMSVPAASGSAVAAEVIVIPRSLLLGHPVHRGRAVVDLADLVVAARVVEDPLGGGGLARVDVRHDPDVAGLGQGVSLVRHCRASWAGSGGRCRRGFDSLERRQAATGRQGPVACYCTRAACRPGAMCQTSHLRALGTEALLRSRQSPRPRRGCPLDSPQDRPHGRPRHRPCRRRGRPCSRSGRLRQVPS